uniref:Uncharacterized protein n=1 Tax=Sinocyclocheilus grahami TaxID=75366 RepID=A0A672K7P3_SINGR
LSHTLTSASESKREQFRRYLEKAGVLDSLTNVLVALYEETEKPSNALDLLGLVGLFWVRQMNSSASQTPELTRQRVRLEPGETSNAQWFGRSTFVK